jgi:hypothetical protein
LSFPFDIVFLQNRSFWELSCPLHLHGQNGSGTPDCYGLLSF